MEWKLFFKILRLCVLAGAAALIGRPAVPASAEACAGCIDQVTCSSIPQGWPSCVVEGNACRNIGEPNCS